MNKNVQMLLFVLVLGIFTSGLLIGMDLLTKDRIEANKNIDIQTTVLRANNFTSADYSIATINDFFNQEVRIHEVNYEGNQYTFYEGIDSGYITFRFQGGGVWGDIIGMITFENDFQTVVQVTILEQQETPGLGGVVAEAPYLAQFVGKIFDLSTTKFYTAPNTDLPIYLEINKDNNPVNAVNEVDTIAGATRTSKAFELILNQSYQIARAAWNARVVD